MKIFISEKKNIKNTVELKIENEITGNWNIISQEYETMLFLLSIIPSLNPKTENRNEIKARWKTDWNHQKTKDQSKNRKQNQASDRVFSVIKLSDNVGKSKYQSSPAWFSKKKEKWKQGEKRKMASEEMAQFSGVVDMQRRFTHSRKKEEITLQSGLLSLNFTESSQRSSSLARKYKIKSLHKKEEKKVERGNSFGNEGAVWLSIYIVEEIRVPPQRCGKIREWPAPL